MRELLVILFTIIINFNTYCQVSIEDITVETRTLKEKILSLQSENNKLKNELNLLKSEIGNTNQKLKSVEQLVANNATDIRKTNSELSGKIINTETSTNQKFNEVDNSLSKNSLWSIIGVLGAIIVSGIVYWLVSKKQSSDKSDVENQISKTKKSLEEESIKLDTKLTEVLETQLKLVQVERAKIPANKSDEIDHSLALKVADEIVRINKNLSNMDEGTKGLKQLSASVKRIEDNFAANGYEMPELLNKPFNSGMKIIVANSIPDDNLKEGEEIITKIIKPQINYRGVMIQAAQVEVSVG